MLIDGSVIHSNQTIWVISIKISTFQWKGCLVSITRMPVSFSQSHFSVTVKVPWMTYHINSISIPLCPPHSSLFLKGLSPIHLSSVDASIPMGHMLHPAVEGAVTEVSLFPWSCTPKGKVISRQLRRHWKHG